MDMIIDDQIRNHEHGLEILEAIKSFRNRRIEALKRIQSPAGSLFFNLKDKWEHDAEIYKMAEDRLQSRYCKIMQSVLGLDCTDEINALNDRMIENIKA